MLSQQELQRYSRHIVLEEIGREGQEKLKESKILIIGLGGLGSPCALYLAASGIGTLGLVDFDNVEENNLQRQIIHSTRNIKKSKLESANESILNLNPNINIILHNIKLDSENILDIIKNYDVIVDCTDNFQTRYLINDACLILNKPNIYGSIFKFEGQASVFNYKNGPCYRCLVPEFPKHILNCAEAGVLGVLPGIIGTIQATETIKIILDKGNILSGRLLAYDALSMKFKEIKLNKNKNCRCNRKIEKLEDYKDKTDDREIDVFELKKKLDNKEVILVDIRESPELMISKLNYDEFLPLSKIRKGYLGNLKCNDNIVFYCRSGNRTLEAVDIFRSKGFKKVKSLKGGINEWARKIDNSLQTY